MKDSNEAMLLQVLSPRMSSTGTFATNVIYNSNKAMLLQVLSPRMSSTGIFATNVIYGTDV